MDEKIVIFRCKGRPLNQEPKFKMPVHEQVYQQIRNLILFGGMIPGEAVTINGLIETLGVGMTPVREAIRRLTSEGALEFRGNRRIILPTLTPQSLEELTFLRLAIEPKLAEMAAQTVREEDILHLIQLDDKLDRAIQSGDVNAYLRLNYEFHRDLYLLANSPILNDVVDGLWLRFGPSLRVVCGQYGTRQLDDKHKRTIEALRSRDGKRAFEAISADISQGLDLVKSDLLRENAS